MLVLQNYSYQNKDNVLDIKSFFFCDFQLKENFSEITIFWEMIQKIKYAIKNRILAKEEIFTYVFENFTNTELQENLIDKQNENKCRFITFIPLN